MTARPHLPVALVILVLLGCLWSRTRVRPFDAYDQPFYLGIAFDLVHHARFTDGFRFADADAAGGRPPGMRFTPLYPALLAAIATVEPGMERDMDCLVAHGGTGCGHRARGIRGLQFALLAASLWMVWWCGWQATGSLRTASLALVLALATAPLLLLSVDYLMTEIVSLFLCLSAQALVLRGLAEAGRTNGRGRWFAAAGLALGLAALTRPGFAVLGVAAAGVAVLWGAREPGRRARMRASCGFVLGFAVALLPWMLRNRFVLDRFALTFGYGAHTLVQRLSFDTMSGRELALAFACWMPDGNGIGAALAGPPGCRRFGWDDPDGFYLQGIGPLLDRTLRENGGWNHYMDFLLRTRLLHDPLRQLGWHALVGLPLAERGLAVDHWWGFVLAPVCLVLTVRAIRLRQDRLLLLCLPGWFMLALNAAVAVNQPRYNLMLVLPFSVCGAIAGKAAIRRLLHAGRARRPLPDGSISGTVPPR